MLICQVFCAPTQIPPYDPVRNPVIRSLVAFNLKSMSYIHSSIFYRSNQLFALAGVVAGVINRAGVAEVLSGGSLIKGHAIY